MGQCRISDEKAAEFYAPNADLLSWGVKVRANLGTVLSFVCAGRNSEPIFT